MIRISTTTLESFRRVLETEYGDEAALIAQIKGVPLAPSWQMEAGSAWHRLLAGHLPKVHAEEFTTGGMLYHRMDGFVFSEAAVAAGRALIGPGVWEVKETRKPWPLGNITVVAQVDHLAFSFGSIRIQENKTKFTLPDAKDYEPSLQWRFYLWIHQAHMLRYNLFHFKEPDGGGYCEFKEVVSLKFWPYVGLEKDCLEWVNRFMEWAGERSLLSYLERESSTPEAP